MCALYMCACVCVCWERMRTNWRCDSLRRLVGELIMARACPFFSTMHRFNTFPFVLFLLALSFKSKRWLVLSTAFFPSSSSSSSSLLAGRRERDTRHDTNILYFIPVKYRSFPHSFKNRYHVVLMELYLFFSSPPLISVRVMDCEALLPLVK